MRDRELRSRDGENRPVSISNFNPIAENRSSLASYAYAIEPMTGPASISRPKGTCRPDAGRLDGARRLSENEGHQFNGELRLRV